MQFKHRILLLSFFSLLVFSCSQDDSSDTIPGMDKSANLKSVGTSAKDFLRADNFTSINLEIAYVEGFKPTQAAIDGLEAFILKHCHKPANISTTETIISPTDKDSLNADDVAKIEADSRTVYNEGEKLGVWVFFADKNSAKDEGNNVILGTSYRNTSCVIYEKTIKQIASGIVGSNLAKIEGTTLQHEFGHLFGLVDLGTPMQTDHRDTSQDDAEANIINRHCTVESCLMYYRTVTNIFSMSMGSDIAPLDDFCQADLQANGGK